MWRSFLPSFVIIAAVGCSSTKPPENDGNATPSSTETASRPTASHETQPGDVPLTDHELSPSDCQVLGEKFRDLTISDLRTRLKPELTPEQREQGEQSIREGAAKLAKPWTEGCLRDLVGKFAPEEALKCAMSSKTVATFDACLNAPPPPKK